jgi:hypothetical protein
MDEQITNDQHWIDQINNARLNAAIAYYEIGEAMFHLNKKWTQRDIAFTWEYSVTQVNYFINAYKIVERLFTIVNKRILPSSEPAARALVAYDKKNPGKLDILWQTAIELTKGAPPTIAYINKAIQQLKDKQQEELEEKEKELRLEAEKQEEEQNKLEEEQRKLEEAQIKEISLVNLDDDDSDFNDMLLPIKSPKKINEDVKRIGEEIRQEIIDRREEANNQTDVQIAKAYEEIWDSVIQNDMLRMIDRLRLARVMIKMLLHKYPKLMDEPLTIDS